MVGTPSTHRPHTYIHTVDHGRRYPTASETARILETMTDGTVWTVGDLSRSTGIPPYRVDPALKALAYRGEISSDRARRYFRLARRLA